MNTETIVDMGEYHPDTLDSTARECLAILDRIDGINAMLAAACEIAGILPQDYGDAVVSERVWAAEAALLEKLGRVAWLQHRQEVKKEMEALSAEDRDD